MKHKILSLIILISLIVSSCELDNYDAPDAKFFGAIIDKETGDTIPQDLIDGSKIDYIELGYKNPQIQQLRFHVDGTFRNDLMFSGDYKIIPTRGNFFSPDTLNVYINKGENKIDFLVTPYCTIKNEDVRFELKDYKGKLWLLAYFKVIQHTTENIKELMLAIDENPNVGLRINTKYFKRPFKKMTDPDKELLLYISLEGLKEGTKYYIRIGALADIPEARYNWCKAIRVDPFSLPQP